jgi:hypothetical protein
VPIGTEEAQALAYYESADGIGLLAPRGWYCEGASGSSGAVLYLSPDPIWSFRVAGLEGPAIEVYHIDGETSGRYEIATIMARAFPAYRAFAARVLERVGFPIPTGPYPQDALTYRDKKIVEYKTPAQTEGLGNFESWLGKNDLPINGAAIIVGDINGAQSGVDLPDLVLRSVRFPAALSGLVPVIISQFERDTVGARR